MASAVRRLALVTHARPETIGDALARAEALARAGGVEIVAAESGEADLVVALGGDGTMLRALKGSLGTPTPVLGIKFGRVGFLTSVDGSELEQGLRRVLAGEYRVVELATLRATLEGASHDAINDVVVTSSTPGRMVELGWEIGGEHLGSLPCDGMICCTPSGSTAYNLSNGGPVMVWGLDAMAVSFVAAHSLNSRPIVVPRGPRLAIANRSPDTGVTVLADGYAVGRLAHGQALDVSLGAERSRLACLPEVTFFARYHDVFA